MSSFQREIVFDFGDNFPSSVCIELVSGKVVKAYSPVGGRIPILFGLQHHGSTWREMGQPVVISKLRTSESLQICVKETKQWCLYG